MIIVLALNIRHKEKLPQKGQAIIGILPIKRKCGNRKDDLLAPFHENLNSSNIQIFFPEGSRGEPEHLTNFKAGVAKLA